MNKSIFVLGGLCLALAATGCSKGDAGATQAAVSDAPAAPAPAAPAATETAAPAETPAPTTDAATPAADGAATPAPSSEAPAAEAAPSEPPKVETAARPSLLLQLMAKPMTDAMGELTKSLPAPSLGGGKK